MILSFLAAMMESASLQTAKNYQRADVNRAMECVFAEYQKDLQEDYDIFALEGSYGQGAFSKDQILERMGFYGTAGIDQEIQRLQLLTDQNGAAFREQIIAYMENKYGLEYVKGLAGESSIWKSQEEKSDDYVNESDQTEAELNQMLEDNDSELPTEDNPILHVDGLKSMSLLELLMPENTSVSEKRISLDQLVSHRTLAHGFGDFSDQERPEGTAAKLLFGEYVMSHFESAGQEQKEEGKSTPLDYELEYILMGKQSDRENLEAVAGRLLFIRYVPNYLFIQSDAEMKAEAEALALTLCSLLTVPEIAEAVKQAILLAWAYGESIMDLRSLLGGKKIPLVKSKESWQLGLSSLLKLGTEEDPGDGADMEGGVSYQGYLRILLFLENRENISMRVLDLVEQNLKARSGLEFFQADACVSRMELRSTCHLRRGITYEFLTYFGYN